MTKHEDKHNTESNTPEEVVFEAETDADMVGGSSTFGGAQDTQVKKLKKKLKEAEQKAKENLDGWQRLKADVANKKQSETERLTRERARGAEDVLESLLPALDSFDSAMQAQTWNNIDDAWRTGMEFVYNQLVQSLESHGITAFGSVGDVFDEQSYEAGEHADVAVESEDGKVQKVLRKGYKSSTKVIRPARVTVGKFIK